jgi:hypothetical protein
VSRLLEELRSEKPCLIASLINNSIESAKAAIEAGADGLKLHLNFDHRPSGARTGSFEEEQEQLLSILELSEVPVGIVPRPGFVSNPAEIERYRDLRFDFVDFYGRNVSPSVLAVKGISKWIAAELHYSPAMISELATMHQIDVIEGAFLTNGEYGQRLSVEDIVRLKIIADMVKRHDKPFVLPTDRRLFPEDVPSLIEAGVSNLMIGVAVTGVEPKGIFEGISAFRTALDSLR